MIIIIVVGIVVNVVDVYIFKFSIKKMYAAEIAHCLCLLDLLH